MDEIEAVFTDPFNPVPEGLREPTGEECNTNARVGPGFAAWYPQMGGYVGACVVVPDQNCFDAYVWHDGDFPFGSVDTWGDARHPARIHHCDPDQFIEFGEMVKRLLPDYEHPPASERFVSEIPGNPKTMLFYADQPHAKDET